MIEYTSLDVSKRLAEAGFEGRVDAIATDSGKIVRRHRADTLMEWLLSHGDSIEITPDLDGFNVTYWVKHDDYNGINIFLPDALGEVVLKVLAKEAEHDKQG